MAGIGIETFGQWSEAGVVLKNISAKLNPTFQAQMTEDGEMILEKLRGHISAQDLGWTPLSDHTVELKNGNTTIYVETGYLMNNLEVRKVRSTTFGATLFIGASAWKTHPSGVKFSDLMIWLENGTSKMPARPLIQPTWEEVQDIVKSNWEKCLKDLISG